MISLPLHDLPLKTQQRMGKKYVQDVVRKNWLILTPEEMVRQKLLYYLTRHLDYPPALIAVEKTIRVGSKNKRFDIVVFNKKTEPWMLIECKRPEVEIDESVLHQLLNYHSSLQTRYWVLCNGISTFCADATHPQHIKWLENLPVYDG